MFQVKRYNKPKKVGIHIILLSSMLVFITIFGFTLSQTFTSFIEADVNGALRGESYDLWADLVLGKRDFTEITPREVVPDKVSSPGGVIVDRTTSPGRAYIWDSGNSRIIGIDLANCYATGSGERCSADIVIGQPSATDYGACNQDSSFQYYPDRSPSSASTLCGMAEWAHTTLEDKSFTSMHVDSNGDLYVADVVNNRVLKYISPFTTDQIADEVWGQVDFTGNKCNLTKEYTTHESPEPTASSLCFGSIGNGGAGVVLDPDGNLWVADGGNSRVLRYPNNSGTIAKTADIVIGQSNFTSGGDYSGGTGLNQFGSLGAVKFDPSGNMYVADTGNSRVLKFTPPFSTGMSGTVLIPSSTITHGLNSLEMTPDLDGLWTYENDEIGTLFRKWDLNGNYQNTQFTNWSGGGGSIGFDTLGNILISAYVSQQDVARFAVDNDTYTEDKSFFSPPGGYNLTSARRLEQGGWGGIAVTDTQLIATDSRLLYWNNPLSVSNGQAPSGYVGAASAVTLPDPGYSIVKKDGNNRIYVAKGTSIYVYQAPLNNSSTPITILNPPFNAVGGGTVGILNTIGGLVPTENGDYLWVSNPDNNRVFRIRNPLTSPQVDIVLGQTSLSGTYCNRNLVPPPNVDGSTSADRTMLCIPGALSLDNFGNLFVSDHFFESAGNWRLLMFDSSLFPEGQSTVTFNIAATKEFPRVNNITNFAPGTFELAFDSTNRMVTGYNPYLGPRFVEYYNNPTAYNSANRSDPAYAVANGRIEDFMGWAFAMTFDNNDNLFIYDTNRGKILIYEDPFGTPDPVDPGEEEEEENNGGNNGNQNNNNQNNVGGNTYYYYSNGNSYTQNNYTTPSSTKPTKPVSYTQPSKPIVSYVNVSDDLPVVENNEPVVPIKNNTENENSVLGLVIEFIKNSDPQGGITFAAISFSIFILLITIALLLTGANVFAVIPLLIDNIFNRQKRYGGIIYNSVTGKPVVLAKVSLLQKGATSTGIAALPVESGLTDLEGRYKSNQLPSKNLVIEVKSLGYQVFTQSLPANIDVGLVPVTERNLFRRIFSMDKGFLFQFLRILTILTSVWGYVVTIYAQVENPNNINFLLLAIYSVLFILAAYPTLFALFLKKIYISDEFGSKLSSAIVRIYKDTELVDLAITNKNGIAKFNLDEGFYKVITSKLGYNYNEVQIEIGEEKNIRNEIKLQNKTQNQPLESSLDLHDQIIQNNHDKFNLH